jgi:Zn-dependent protease
MIITILVIVALIFSAILHEFAHGYAAFLLGDDTAKNAGRLTLNPINHLDPIGSILLPALLILSHSNFFIAWAKPVPYNPFNLRDRRFGDLKVALAGPATNLVIAVFFGLVARFMPIVADVKFQLAKAFLEGDSDTVLNLVHGSMFGALFFFASIIVFVNLGLMLFNLIPMPPLDGSKVLYTFLPTRFKQLWLNFEPYSFIVLLVLAYSGIFSFIFNFVLVGFSLLVGI